MELLRSLLLEKKLSERIFTVHIPAQVFNGRDYAYETAKIKVVATSRDEAVSLINQHKEDVLRFLETQRVQPSNKKLLPTNQPAKKSVIFKDDYFVKSLTAKAGRNVLTRHGGFKSVNLNDTLSESRLST